MPADDNAVDSKRPSAPGVFRIPQPLKQLFDRFPLLSHPANALPLSSPNTANETVLYIFTTPSSSKNGAPSFNPTCLRWQAYLRFHHIPFRTVPSNNHASPSGALPFLLPAQSSPSSPSTAVSSSSLTSWIKEHSNTGPAHHPETDPLPLKPYHSLISHAIRLSYLYALYVHPLTFESVAERLYLHPASSSRLVREALAYPLRKAAYEEILNATRAEGARSHAGIDTHTLGRRADEAFEALSVRLGHAEWFSEALEVDAGEGRGRGPGMLDAMVFSYTHVILEFFADEDAARPAGRLVGMIRERQNLVAHRDRILGLYFGREKAA